MQYYGLQGDKHETISLKHLLGPRSTEKVHMVDEWVHIYLHESVQGK